MGVVEDQGHGVHRKHPLGDPSLDQVEMTEEDVDAEGEGEEGERQEREITK